MSIAAGKLGISQQALSKGLLSLEDELGLKLFHREKTGMRPTKQGLVILEKAAQILEGVDSLLATAEDLKGRPANSLSIGIPEGLIGASSAPIPIEKLISFNDQDEGISYLIKELPNDSIRKDVLSGSLDSGLIVGDTPTKCACLPLLEASLKAMVLDSSPLARKSFVTWEDLRDCEFVIAVDDRRIKADIIDRCGQCGFEPTFLPPVSQFEGNISLACASNAVLLCHDEARISESANESVTILEFRPEDTVSFSLSYIWNESQASETSHISFMNFLKEALEG